MTYTPQFLVPLPIQSSSNPYPMTAFGGGWIEAFRDAVIISQAPDALIGSSMLSAMACVTQGLVDVVLPYPGASPKSVSLYIIDIADSGERKSTVNSLIHGSVFSVDETLERKDKAAEHGYEIRLRKWKTQYAKLIDELSEADAPQELVDAKLAEHEEKIPTFTRRRFHNLTDATPAAIFHRLDTYGPVASIVSSEGGIVLGSRAVGNLPMLNAAWDGVRIDQQRKVEKAKSIINPRLTIALAVQLGPVRSFLFGKNELARSSGFSARVLWSFPNSTQGYRVSWEKMTHSFGLNSFQERLKELLNETNSALLMGNDFSRKALRFDSQGAGDWLAFSNEIENSVGEGAFWHDAKDHANKVAEIAARVAAIFHCFDGNASEFISVDAFQRAKQLCRWHLNEYKRLFGEQKGIAETYEWAMKVLWWFVSKVKKGEISPDTKYLKSILYKKGPWSVREKSKLTPALEYLERIFFLSILSIDGKEFLQLNAGIVGKCIEWRRSTDFGMRNRILSIYMDKAIVISD